MLYFCANFVYDAPHFYSSNNNFPQTLFRFQFYILSGNSKVEYYTV